MNSKNRSKAIENILSAIRDLPSIEKAIIKPISFRGINELKYFNKINFKRSVEKIDCFSCTSQPGKNLIAVIVDRFLHVYNFISGKVLFEILIPNANAHRHHKGCNHCMFVDNDKLIAVQDGESRVTLINI